MQGEAAAAAAAVHCAHVSGGAAPAGSSWGCCVLRGGIAGIAAPCLCNVWHHQQAIITGTEIVYRGVAAYLPTPDCWQLQCIA